MLINKTEIALIISFASFLMFFLFFFGVIQYFRRSAKNRDLIEKIQGAGYSNSDINEQNSTKAAVPALATPLVSIFRLLGSRVKQNELLSDSGSRITFMRAGIHWEYAGTTFWGAKLFFAFFLPFIFIIFRFSIFKLISYPIAVGISVLTALIGFYMPDIWLKLKTNRRKDILLKSLPDALDLLVVCVEAGMGMDAAFNRVSKEIKFSNPLLSDEINFMNLEMRAGKSRQDSLRNFSLRTGLEEVKSLVTLLIQTDKFGTNVATAIRVFSDSFRTERMQRAEELAAKIPVKLLIPLILFILPSLFVVILGPAAIKIYQNIIVRF